MEGMGPDWKGLLKWSMANSDGTQPAREISDEERRWFNEAMHSQVVDVIKRMKEIALVMSMPVPVLEAQGVTVEELEGMLEELQEHVESIDMANDLDAIGGLVPLLNYLKSPHAGIRSRAAEVVSTVVQNNPKSQQQVLDNQGLEYLLSNFTKDKDITSRTKALGAISSLIRHNKAGTAAFRLANGYAGLRDALSSEDPRFQRKALQLLQYLIQENAKDASAASELGFMHSLISFASNPNADVRQAALNVLLEVARNRGDGEELTTPEETSAVRTVLSDRIDEISRLNPEDLAALKEERHLVDALWQLLFHEPSKLHKDGLLGLPEDDETPPEVAVRSPSLLEASRIRPPDVAQAEDVPVLRLGI